MGDEKDLNRVFFKVLPFMEASSLDKSLGEIIFTP